MLLYQHEITQREKDGEEFFSRRECLMRYGIPKKDLLTKFTEEEYNEALSKMKTM